MGRLFWKFFFFFWLAQVITSAGVGVAIWLLRPGPGPAPLILTPPPALAGKGAQAPQERRGFAMPRNFEPKERRLIEPLFPPWLLPLLASSAVSLLFASLLAWYFSRPIRSLRQAFESVASGKLDTRIGASMGMRQDELADLGAGFDYMTERLQNLMEGQRRLLHDVSHEMRSPLARLQAVTDLIRQQPERSAELLERMERDMGRMDQLIGELLTFARLDAGMAGDLTETVDLFELVCSIADDAQFEAAQKNCRIVVHFHEPIFIRGNRELLHRAAENVVRNALRYSPEGGQITIAKKINAAKQQVEIHISDEGPGVRDDDLKSIFDPFFRCAGAGDPPGYGLGLAITRRIIEAYGGHVAAINQENGGLLVTLCLPSGVVLGQ
jgi:signal transduction histidine kinase